MACPNSDPPSQVTVVPGNHDAYVHEPWSNTFSLWGSYMASDSGELQGPAAAENSVVFPFLRVRGPLALIGLSSASPTAPGFATGSLGGLQLQVLDQLLIETAKRKLIRVVLIHHPPLAPTVNWRKRLTDSAALRKVLYHRGVEMILHGHAHRSLLGYLETSIGRAPVIGVAAASRIDGAHGAEFNLYQYKPSRDGWTMEFFVRRYSPSKNRFFDCSKLSLTLPSYHAFPHPKRC